MKLSEIKKYQSFGIESNSKILLLLDIIIKVF